jgi:hypothetical protein
VASTDLSVSSTNLSVSPRDHLVFLVTSLDFLFVRFCPFRLVVSLWISLKLPRISLYRSLIFCIFLESPVSHLDLLLSSIDLSVPSADLTVSLLDLLYLPRDALYCYWIFLDSPFLVISSRIILVSHLVSPWISPGSPIRGIVSIVQEKEYII